MAFTLLIGRLASGTAARLRLDFSLDEVIDAGRSLALTAYSVESLITTWAGFIWNKLWCALFRATIPGKVMDGGDTETRNSCAMIHPSLLPFVKECLANDALNTQGGTLEVKRPRARYSV